MNYSTLAISGHLVGPYQEESFHADLDDHQSNIDLNYYRNNYYYNVYPDGLSNLRRDTLSYYHTDPRNGTAQTQGGLIIEDSLNLTVMASEESRQYEWRRSDQAMPSSSTMSSSSVTASALQANIDENSIGVRGKAQAQQQQFQQQYLQQQHQQQQQHYQQGSNMPLLLSSSLSSASLPIYQPPQPLAPPQVVFHAGTASASSLSVPTILDEHAVIESSPTPASSPTSAMGYMLSTASQGYVFLSPPSSHLHLQLDQSSHETQHEHQRQHEHEREQLSLSLHGNKSALSYLPLSAPTGFQGYSQQDEGNIAWANASVINTFAVDTVQHEHQHSRHHSQKYYQQQQQKQSRTKKSKRKGPRGQLHVMISPDSGVASICPPGSAQQTKDPISTASPSITAAAVPGHGYTTWGHSSPVDSNFSGSSTPSFASLSPSLSHSSNSESSASCESSRATSPSTLTHESNSGTSLYDTERRKRPSVSDSSVIHARKSSTSSASSTGSISKRRMSILRGPNVNDTLSSPTTTTPPTSSPHKCPQCGLCFAGPAVLVRHIESIHDKLLWNCVGCKSNLSRRDAVTRHINLSPMDSICRAVGTIGQIKMLDGNEVHYEISTYRAKPLEDVIGRMSTKRTSVSGPSVASVQVKESDRVKVESQDEEDIDADGMEETDYGYVSCRSQKEGEGRVCGSG